MAALAQILDAPKRCDDLLAHGLAFATAFDDLEVGAAAGGFLAEIHGAVPWSDSIRVRTRFGKTHIKSTETDDDVALHFCEISGPRKQYQSLTGRLGATTVKDQLEFLNPNWDFSMGCAR